MALKYKRNELSHYKGNSREDYASLDGGHLAGSLFGNNLSNGNVYDKNQLNAVEYISGQEITPELIANSNIANKVAKEDRENAIVNIAGGVIGGIYGSASGAWSSYISGGSVRDILISASVSGGVGATSGFLLQPLGVMNSTAIGMVAGGVGSFMGGAIGTKITNKDAAGKEVLNNALKSGIVGVGAGGVTGLFSVGGKAGAIAAGQKGLMIDMIGSGLNTKYDIIKMDIRNK